MTIYVTRCFKHIFVGTKQLMNQRLLTENCSRRSCDLNGKKVLSEIIIMHDAGVVDV